MTTSRIRRPAGRSRAGTTLVELLIALAVLGLVSSALTTAIVRQQRVNARTVTAIDTRNQGRITLSTLAAELRGVSASGNDISAVAGEMSATTLRVRIQLGNSVICWIDPADRRHFRLPPSGALTNGTLTGFIDVDELPRAGDPLFVYDPSQPTATPWFQTSLDQSVLTGEGSCPSGAGTFVTAAEAPGSYDVRSAAALPAGVLVGSPVRIAREVRYTFGQEDAPPAGDGLWYLYYQACTAAGCTTRAPVSGPFRPGTTDKTTTGFRFRYYDSAGLETAVPTAVARIDVVSRVTSRENVSLGNTKRAPIVQADSVSIALRNRY